MNRSCSLVNFNESNIKKSNVHPFVRYSQKEQQHKEFKIKIIKNNQQPKVYHFDKVGKISHKRFSITRNSLNLNESHRLSQSLFSIDLSNDNAEIKNSNKMKTFKIQTIPKKEKPDDNI